jgi:hypothetical protein
MNERFPEGWDPIAEGYLAGTLMPDGRYWCLMQLTLGRNRIVIVEDQFSPGEHWCYSDPWVGLANWHLGPDHTPEGWSRHMLPDGTFERVEIPKGSGILEV